MTSCTDDIITIVILKYFKKKWCSFHDRDLFPSNATEFYVKRNLLDNTHVHLSEIRASSLFYMKIISCSHRKRVTHLGEIPP